eukprot:CAMPEP_0204032356 /NCGR_PEP_ID=MMETSP0360-20130528/66006_1 /ASSEMBLY_ACC=CAM_ASM_000342 /TAXON_ID=268821 /ORGANISM="Scrippsiella Hangoei, Strain SHTV-5" /LENGTH=73 /DNA_ID=CAMNT_0050976757 /DNA_START=309 /DNA_END=527 /DNA_ORIENTATION=+
MKHTDNTESATVSSQATKCTSLMNKLSGKTSSSSMSSTSSAPAPSAAGMFGPTNAGRRSRTRPSFARARAKIL